MDLGCGQGDQTGAIASLLSSQPERFPHAKIIGVDPAPGDYGCPYTLKEAQEHLAAQPELAAHLEFMLGKTAEEVLHKEQFVTVVLSHSMWYFPSREVLKETFRAIRSAGVKHLLLAEWACTSSEENALPHLWAVLLQSFFKDNIEGGNICTLFWPGEIRSIAERAGWKLQKEVTFMPTEKLQDANWEADTALRAVEEAEKKGNIGVEGFEEDIEEAKKEVREAVDRFGKGGLRCMNVWCAVLVPEEWVLVNEGEDVES